MDDVPPDDDRHAFDDELPVLSHRHDLANRRLHVGAGVVRGARAGQLVRCEIPADEQHRDDHERQRDLHLVANELLHHQRQKASDRQLSRNTLHPLTPP